MTVRAAALAVLPDARPASLVLRLTPDFALPFVQLARLDRPAGWQLLLAPCWQATALAGLALHRGPNLGHLALFLVGAIAMRGAGSTYNDILDRKLDAGVERTRNRPLPSGRVSVTAAAVFLVAQSLVGLAVLLSFNRFSIGLGDRLARDRRGLSADEAGHVLAAGGARPRLLLGRADGLGATFGSLALRPRPALRVRVLLDDRLRHDLRACRTRATTPSSASARPRACSARHARLGVGLFYAAAAALALARDRCSSAADPIALIGWLAYAGHLAWQALQVEGADAATALRLFRSNRDAGLLLFAGIATAGMDWIEAKRTLRDPRLQTSRQTFW